MDYVLHKSMSYTIEMIPVEFEYQPSPP